MLTTSIINKVVIFDYIYESYDYLEFTRFLTKYSRETYQIQQYQQHYSSPTQLRNYADILYSCAVFFLTG